MEPDHIDPATREPDMRAIRHYDWSRLYHDASAIREYIARGLAAATEDQKRSIMLAYLGPKLYGARMDLTAPREDGLSWVDVYAEAEPATGGAPPISVATDKEIFDVFQLADSYHDMCVPKHIDTDPLRAKRLEHIANSVFGTAIGSQDYVKHLPTVTVDGKTFRMTLEDVADKYRFIECMTATNDLVFDTARISNNPLRDRDLTKGAFVYDTGKNNFRKIAFQHKVAKAVGTCRDCAKVELWCAAESIKTPDRQDYLMVIKVRQMAELLNKIRSRHGSAFDFVLDNDDLILQFATNLPVWADEFSKVYRLRDGAREIACDHFNRLLDVQWTRKTCDATLMDAGRHAGEHDPEATGDVFREDSVVEIKLDGASTPQSYAYSLTHGGAATSKSLTENYDDETGEYELYSKNSMKGKVNAAFKKGRTAAVPLALKRAGDWGMVQYCTKNDAVFVTTDLLAAMYAVYRGVRVVHLTLDPALQRGRFPRVEKALLKSGEDTDGRSINFVQYSFTVCGPYAAHNEFELLKGGNRPALTTAVAVCSLAIMAAAALA